MKLVLLMYLAEDDRCVERLLEETGVPTYSRLPVEGVGRGAEGWYGSVPAYESRMILAVVPDEEARTVLDAVRDCRGIADPRHPVRAVQMDVETLTACEQRASGDGPRSANSREERGR